MKSVFEMNSFEDIVNYSIPLTEEEKREQSNQAGIIEFLKAYHKETGLTGSDLKEATNWISEYFKTHPITGQNANIYLLTMAAAAYHEGKERGAQECKNQ